MSDHLEQSQKSGSQSTNVQAGQVVVHQNALSYADVRDIALDVFKNNFEQLTSVSRESARNRAEEITELFLNELSRRNEAGLQKAETPEFQMNLLTVQKEFARTGDKDLGNLLVDLLIDVTKQEGRNVLQIVLSESLAVAPKLTVDQVASLALIFFLRYISMRNVIPLDEFQSFLSASVAPFGALASKKNTCYRHLEFAGCGTVGIGSISLDTAIQETYMGSFTKGFSKEDLFQAVPEIAEFDLTQPAVNDPAMFQFIAANKSILGDALTALGLAPAIIAKVNAFWRSKIFDKQEVRTKTIELVPEMATVFDVWENSSMKSFTLTSVGIAIAHAALRSRTGLDADLSIWIN